MKSYKYLGPHDAVEINGVGVAVLGEPIDIPTELTKEFDAREDFEHVTDNKKKG